MALGARRGDVVGMVARMGLRLVGIGLAAGLLASLAVSRVIANLIWGISPHDPLTLTVVVTTMVTVSALACYFPARRATRVDPMEALRIQ
jgi:putative ABC transport system permease protein